MVTPEFNYFLVQLSHFKFTVKDGLHGSPRVKEERIKSFGKFVVYGHNPFFVN